MRKNPILLQDAQVDALRKLARNEDRPVSEIVRRAADRDLEQRAAILRQDSNRTVAFPVFHGGRVLVSASHMKSVLYSDEAP